MNRQRKEKEYSRELKSKLKHHGLLREMIELRQKYQDTPAGFQSQEDYKRALLDWEAEDRRFREKGIYSVRSVRPEKVRHFAGRGEEIAFIQENLEAGRSPVFLYGMGGIGKTTIAAAYVERYGGEYENVLFLYYDGSIRSLITDDNRVQINELIYQPEKHGSRLRYYRKKLEALRQIMRMQRTLAVLDNCNLSEQKMDKEILTFLNLPAHILVTGRKKEGALFPVSLEIRPFQKKEDLEQLVQTYVPEKLTKEEERELWMFAAKIDYLTLPLVMKMRCFELETEQNAEFLEFKKGLLTAFHLKKSELLVLMYLAIMPAEGMPLELYLEWSGAEVRILERLENYLLIFRQREGDQEMVRMHPLIAESVLEAMPPTAANCKTILQNSWRHILGYDSFDKETVWTRSYRKNQQEGPYIFALLKALSGPIPWMAKAQWQELERLVPDRFRFSNNWRVFQDFRARNLERQGREAEAVAITEEMLDGLELYTIKQKNAAVMGFILPLMLSGGFQYLYAVVNAAIFYGTFSVLSPSKIGRKVWRELWKNIYAKTGLMLLLWFGSFIFQRQVNRLSETVIAAAAYVMAIYDICTEIVYAYGVAALVATGQNYGSRERSPDRYGAMIRYYNRKFLVQGVFFSICFLLLFWIGGDELIQWTAGSGVSEQLVDTAAGMLRIISLGYPALAVLLVCRCALQSMGEYQIQLILGGLGVGISLLCAHFVVQNGTMVIGICIFLKLLIPGICAGVYYAMCMRKMMRGQK